MTKSEVYEGFSHVFCDESTQVESFVIFEFVFLVMIVRLISDMT
ncbi:hypothetical protein Hanom_Chr10g00936421 [Helianthus anomalus]